LPGRKTVIRAKKFKGQYSKSDLKKIMDVNPQVECKEF